MPIKVALITLGCAKNTADSEAVKGILMSRGFMWCKNTKTADVILVNTCGFIKDAKEQSIDTIFDIIAQKRSNQKLIVFGCLAQRYSEKIREEIPEIDGIVGNFQLTKLPEIISKLSNQEVLLEVNDPATFQREDYYPRERIDKGVFSYIKIADGCDNYCSYCVIPSVKGKYKSKLPDDIIREAERVVESGTKEIVLIAQDTGSYGNDLNSGISLPYLLRQLVRIEKLQWLRILYCYPNHLTDELIFTIAEENKICNYLDIPLQHLSDPILKRMGRNITKRQIYSIIERIKCSIPNISLRSTFIVGFPGETINDFNLLKEGLTDLELTWSGFFAYSREEGTPAALMSNQISEEVKQERIEYIESVQKEITYGRLSKFIGRVLPVMIEDMHANDNDWYLGRSYLQSPEIDGQIHVKTFREKAIGKILPVRIEGVSNNDLIGEVVNEPGQ